MTWPYLWLQRGIRIGQAGGEAARSGRLLLVLGSHQHLLRATDGRRHVLTITHTDAGQTSRPRPGDSRKPAPVERGDDDGTNDAGNVQDIASSISTRKFTGSGLDLIAKESVSAGEEGGSEHHARLRGWETCQEKKSGFVCVGGLAEKEIYPH